ncbi:para-nitrobenzyl esterase [Fusarium langsethiae]|uniref:Para-nitrobenzyl esterase n=1 Tax=Fusarium langsethiae TaxID=179993 RepID=A0A0N0V4T0_FUSLA|nr:para-nitrobenzyl esterase [Fusarium langsethiae]GKU08521.1 unnamed protein product [Fusarium langsethiae]GKU11229.1 unnamed protein product [Fusarium langsethiae]
MASLNHSKLGEIQGLELPNQGIVQYLGIQYATVAHRFAVPDLRSNYDDTIDATSRGPPVVRPPLACDLEFGLIQQALDKPQYPPMSDLNGLNLDITIPQEATTNKDAKLPVLVFIHGGAFILGDSGAPHYDMAASVAYSQTIGKPIIGVSINYRLGVAGFLDSNELRASGAPPNRGLLDQKTAFEWLRRNISGFSGDPARITAIGQSAGASSIMHLLDLESSEDTLFDRAICLSGNNLAVPMSTRSVAQDAYKAVLKCLEIESTLSSEDQVRALITSSPEDILSKVPLSIPLQPVIGTDEVPSFREIEAHLASRKYKTPLMIGSTDFDAVIFEVLGLFADREQGSLAREFIKYLSSNVPATHCTKLERLVTLYNISVAEEDDQTRVKIIQFGTDLKYYATSKHYALSWPTQSWLYYFNESNPWEGPHQGRSAHCLDIAYLFLNFNDVMNNSQRETATGFARDVIEFTNRGLPWGEFRISGEMKVYGSHGKSQAPSQEIQALWTEIGLDNLVQGWHAFSAKL